MSRLKRQYTPGAVFHVTTRCQARTHWFDDAIRDEIVRAVRDSLHKSDAILLAFAVMTNHLHFVIRQMRDPLSALMQPLLTRAARRTQRMSGATNHIFGDRYFSKPCTDVGHARNAIAYVNTNPARDGLCSDPIQYRWSSERYYRMPSPGIDCGDLPVSGLHLFSPYAEATHEIVVANYLHYVSLLYPTDYDKVDDDSVGMIDLCGGDEIWRLIYGSPLSIDRGSGEQREDLRDIAQRILARDCPGLELEDLYWIKSPGIVSKARRAIVEAALRAGYSGAKTARFLRVSEAMVSRNRRSLLAQRMDAPMGRDARMEAWSDEGD